MPADWQTAATEACLHEGMEVFRQRRLKPLQLPVRGAGWRAAHTEAAAAAAGLAAATLFSRAARALLRPSTPPLFPINKH